MSHTPDAPFLFVIDTADYAGNFERELCAFITGCTGECEVGESMAERFRDETKLDAFENVISEPDEHGRCRPVTIYPTPGTFGNGLGGSFKDGQEAESLAHYKAAAASIYGGYAAAPRRHLEVLASDDEKAKAELARLGWTVEACHRNIADHEAKIAAAQALTETPKYRGAYCSVAISFETEPTAEQIALMKARAATFAAQPAHNYGFAVEERPRISAILGFRLVKQTITRTTEETSL